MNRKMIRKTKRIAGAAVVSSLVTTGLITYYSVRAVRKQQIAFRKKYRITK